jgi:SAM-dependent methyltransferase
MTSAVFDRYASYYDLLYHDKDYEAEAMYVAQRLRSIQPDAEALLEFGVGTGRHAQLLRSHGFKVFGVDRSESMITAARARGLNCMQGDIQTIRLQRPFDGVIALFHVISYQVTDEEVARTFANANRNLHPGGGFLFDVWHAQAVLAQRLSVRVKRAEDQKIRVTRTAEPEINAKSKVATVRYRLRVDSKIDGRIEMFQEEHQMRYFFPAEIDEFAEDSGFKVERSEEFLTGNVPSENTWGVCYLLRKNAEIS